MDLKNKALNGLALTSPALIQFLFEQTGGKEKE